MLDLSPFWAKFWILLFVLITQTALWTWVGLQAQQRLPWWPLKMGNDLVSSEKLQQGQQKES
jgi:hypothetical protein